MAIIRASVSSENFISLTPEVWWIHTSRPQLALLNGLRQQHLVGTDQLVSKTLLLYDANRPTGSMSRSIARISEKDPGDAGRERRIVRIRRQILSFVAQEQRVRCCGSRLVWTIVVAPNRKAELNGSSTQPLTPRLPLIGRGPPYFTSGHDSLRVTPTIGRPCVSIQFPNQALHGFSAEVREASLRVRQGKPIPG